VVDGVVYLNQFLIMLFSLLDDKVRLDYYVSSFAFTSL